MNRGVLRSDVDLRYQSDRQLLWSTTSTGYQVTPLNAGPTLGASVSWPASANTLTSWTEITSSSPFDCCAIDVYMSGHYQNGANTALLFDIGTGAGGGEVVLVDGIPLFGHNRFLCIRFPIRVAAGTRFAFRCQAAIAAGSLTAPASPTVALGFIRDIPEFPAGTSVAAIGSIDRTNSVYNPTGLSLGQARNTWRYIGAVPAGKMIYAVPIATAGGSAALQSATQFTDFGWITNDALSFNDQTDEPLSVFCADQFIYTDTSEPWNPVVPTVWIPDGFISGGIVAAIDTANAFPAIMCFAVME